MENKQQSSASVSASDYTEDQNSVLERECKHLGITDADPVRAFAISGGGIRSASFGMGVMQALVANDELKNMTYMSTVSGGGYLGSALTWALHRNKHYGLSPDNFPLGVRLKPGVQENADAVKNESGRLLAFLRLHASYLTPTGWLGLTSLAAVALRSILIALIAYFSILLCIMVFFEWGHFFNWAALSDYAASITTRPFPNGVFLPLGALCFLIYGVLVFTYSLGTYRSKEAGSAKSYLHFITWQGINGILWKVGFTMFLIGSVSYAHLKLQDLIGSIVAGSSTLFGTLVGIWNYIKAQKNDKSASGPPDFVIYLAAIALMYGLLLLAYIASGYFFANDRCTLVHPFVFVAFFAFTLLFGLRVNLNLAGPHRIWRDRLMETFMPGADAVLKNQWQPAKEADDARMEAMCGEDNPRPYHIINTNIILTDSEQVKYRSRGGDNFIISPLFCGGESTGWRTTATFQKKKCRGITLATAMATSAAALNPNAGVAGQGVTRNRIISILLSTLNLRLGYWTVNPRSEGLYFKPNFFEPGISNEIMEGGFKESSDRILLSDGGHFENLAVYELIRRRVKVIVVSDGGADAPFNFDDLANLIEKARVDFNTRILFRDDYSLANLLPGSAGDSEYIKRYGIAKKGFAVADISYDDGSKGILFYVKLTVIEDLPSDLYSYKGVHPEFPHESTADQFFDEKQFEAYRELGYYIGWKMMESDPGKQYFPVKTKPS